MGVVCIELESNAIYSLQQNPKVACRGSVARTLPQRISCHCPAMYSRFTLTVLCNLVQVWLSQSLIIPPPLVLSFCL